MRPLPRRMLALTCAATAAFLSVPARAAAQEPARQHERDLTTPVFRLTVSLVQVDAVVTDRKGRHVTTLGPEDFRVFLDGKPQPVNAVAYVDKEEIFLDADGRPLPVRAPSRARDAGRVVAIVVDDARMGFESLARTRSALRQVVDRLLRVDDLATIVTTSANQGTSWPFTYDRAGLRSAAARLRFTLSGVTAASVLDPIDRVTFFGNDTLEDFREEVFAIAALKRIDNVITAVRELPGRKAVVLVSEGFSMFGQADQNAFVRELMRQLVDRANRSGVVVYAVDPRGLVWTGLTAADSPRSAAAAGAVAARRRDALLQTQDGLRFLAGETGGFAVINNNDIPQAFHRIMTDQRGYYLVGFQPPDGTITSDYRRFRSMKIKVVRPGLEVRTRAGFYGIATE